MKLTHILLAILILTACNQNKPSVQTEVDLENKSTEEVGTDEKEKEEKEIEYDVIDAQSMGLFGNVQSVTTLYYHTIRNNGELSEGNQYRKSEMTFDQWGRVTIDEWGNEYGYDADGNYYRGNHTYTIIKRDKLGRLKEYIDEEPNTDNDENQKLSFVYDKTGRLKTVTQGGWTGHWQEQRSYEGSNIYPSKIITTADYEGGGESLTTTTYRYSRFDEKKNWIERICVISATETDDTDSLVEQTRVDEQIQIEKRNIIYYE